MFLRKIYLTSLIISSLLQANTLISQIIPSAEKGLHYLNVYFDTTLSYEQKLQSLKDARSFFASPKVNDTLFAIKSLIQIFSVKQHPSREGVKEIQAITAKLDSITKKTTASSLINLCYGILQVELFSLGKIKRFFAWVFYGEIPQPDNPELAVIHLLDAANTLPFSPMIQYFLAEAYFNVNNHSYAIRSLEKAINQKDKTLLTFVSSYFRNLARSRLKTFQNQSN